MTEAEKRKPLGGVFRTIERAVAAKAAAEAKQAGPVAGAAAEAAAAAKAAAEAAAAAAEAKKAAAKQAAAKLTEAAAIQAEAAAKLAEAKLAEAKPVKVAQTVQTKVNTPLPIKMTLTNLFQYISFTSPVLVIFFITLFSIMENTMEKGLIYCMGILILGFIVTVLKYVAQRPQDPKASPFCNVMPWPFTFVSTTSAGILSFPSISTSVLSFSSSYLIYPMIKNNQQNYQLISFLIAITCLNAVVEIHQKCGQVWEIVVSIAIGACLGALYYFILNLSNKSNLVYFSDTISNNVQCSKPTAQNFRCKVTPRGDTIAGG